MRNEYIYKPIIHSNILIILVKLICVRSSFTIANKIIFVGIKTIKQYIHMNKNVYIYIICCTLHIIIFPFCVFNLKFFFSICICMISLKTYVQVHNSIRVLLECVIICQQLTTIDHRMI